MSVVNLFGQSAWGLGFKGRLISMGFVCEEKQRPIHSFYNYIGPLNLSALSLFVFGTAGVSWCS